MGIEIEGCFHLLQNRPSFPSLIYIHTSAVRFAAASSLMPPPSQSAWTHWVTKKPALSLVGRTRMRFQIYSRSSCRSSYLWLQKPAVERQRKATWMNFPAAHPVIRAGSERQAVPSVLLWKVDPSTSICLPAPYAEQTAEGL
ncbi:uncharacterized protein FYW61_010474 isoform 1-T1 [Anableps anableps]